MIYLRLEGLLADSGKTLNPAVSRRTVFRGLAGFLAGSPLLRSQQDPFRDHSRVPALGELLNAFDFEPVAQAKVARQAWDYLSWGVDGEFTMRRNREAFDWVGLVPRGIAGAGPVQPASNFLGMNLPFPMLIAPTARHVMFHPDAEAATYAGATAASNTPLIVSNRATLPVEKIAAAATGPWWFQLYPQPVPDYHRQTLEKAQAAGCRAIVVTVDQQASVYERQTHGQHLATSFSPVLAPTSLGPRRPRANPYRVPDGRLWYEWTLLDELRRMVKVPLLVKGIVTGEDARLCLEHGVDAIYLSNHGGRSLDYCPSTLEVLPEIADAVQGRIPILFDGGIRRGSDILKALALGASAIGLGRVPLWGLAAYGPQGVQRVLEILQAELVQAMAATGRPTLASIDRTLVRTEFL
jgi:isopentenyl diphosphate isomerase/L-lactate dehydrogenase-like FMN-dependent dehydrogenase